jgi:O-antigen/teichoic acid export membrane protein
VSSPTAPTSQPDQINLIFRNVSWNYLVTGTELLIGIFMLPFNVAHLGQSTYGLWVLAASIPVYFSMFDMGYGVALVRFAAKYRAERNSKALNEVASTMFYLFSGLGLLTFALAIVLSLNLEHLFNLTEVQASTGRAVFLFISAYVALGLPFSVFGGIVNGFQRMYLNGVVAFVTAITVATVNVVVLLMGYGLVELVAATTSVRMLSYLAYALNAYRVFPELHIRLRHFSQSRLREVTGFSVFILLIDLANKLNYSTDTIVIGAFLGTASVAVWAVAQRLIEIVQRITDQLNSVLFPVVVDTSTIQQHEKLQNILLQGTRLSLAMVVPLAITLAFLADPLIAAWVGPGFAGSVSIIHVLSIAVSLRVGTATSSMLLKGSGRHKILAISNIAMALSNLGLSILLVRWYGLLGVAIGTLLPMIVTSTLVVFPAACRRVQLNPLVVIRKSVWPPIWPAIVVSIFLVGTSSIFRGGWRWVLTQAAGGIGIYGILFLRFAISRDERHWYFSKVTNILGWHSLKQSTKELSLRL